MAKQKNETAVSKTKSETKGENAPARYYWDEPFRSFHEEMDRMFDRFFGGAAARPGRLSEWDPFRGGAGIGTPSVDVKETKKAFKVTAELPGLDEKDVEVTLSDGLLTIKGEKQSEREEDEENHHVSERRYGSFSRSFRVPDSVDADKVNASFEKGVLTIEMPKSTASQKKSRKIGIKSK